jgi:hypothetical protein
MCINMLRNVGLVVHVQPPLSQGTKGSIIGPPFPLFENALS